MNELLFLVRYTPFWAIPMGMLSAEFAYVFWLRKKKKWIAVCLVISCICAVFLLYYYWAGGPERSVEKLIKLIRFYTY